jgi:hypothetical protein
MAVEGPNIVTVSGPYGIGYSIPSDSSYNSFYGEAVTTAPQIDKVENTGTETRYFAVNGSLVETTTSSGSYIIESFLRGLIQMYDAEGNKVGIDPSLIEWNVDTNNDGVYDAWESPEDDDTEIDLTQEQLVNATITSMSYTTEDGIVKSVWGSLEIKKIIIDPANPILTTITTEGNYLEGSTRVIVNEVVNISTLQFPVYFTINFGNSEAQATESGDPPADGQ